MSATYRVVNSPRASEGFVPALIDFELLMFKENVMDVNNTLWRGVDLNRREKREKYL